MLESVTWRWWCPGSGLGDIPRVRGVAGVRPWLSLDVLEVPGVGVDEEKLSDEGAVTSLLLIEAVEANPASGVTNNQPQWLPDTAKINKYNAAPVQNWGELFIKKNTHTAREQMVLAPVLVRCTVAKALPWVNVSVTWANDAKIKIHSSDTY